MKGAKYRRFRPLIPDVSVRNLGKALAATSLCTLTAWALFPALDLVNIALVYLLGCAWSSLFLGRFASVLATLTSVVEYDYLFVPPRFSIAVYDWHYVVTFALMATVSILISELATRSRLQLDLAQERANRLRALYEFSRVLASRRTLEQIYSDLIERARLELGIRARIENSPAAGCVVPGARGNDDVAFEFSVDAKTGDLRLPIIANGETIAHLIVGLSGAALLERSEHRDLMCSFAALASLVAERTLLSEVAERGQREIEKQEMRNVMLSSVSHDLRTPMTVIIGSTQSLIEAGNGLDPETVRELLDSILRESQRMSDLLNSILEMSWLDSGMIELNWSSNDVAELLAVMLNSLDAQFEGREVRLHLSADLPPVRCDAILISQVIGNLLENASKHTPHGGPVDIHLKIREDRLYFGVLDSGPGIPIGAEERIFEKFYRAHPERRGAGVGLGLAICRTIVALHGGAISAENRRGGGAAFWLWLPIDPTNPAHRLESKMGRS